MGMAMCAMARGPAVATIAGGFVRVEVASLLRAWRACLGRPGGAGDFRAWLAAHEMRARRGRLAEPAAAGRQLPFGDVHRDERTRAQDLGDDRILGAQAVPDVEYHAGLR